MEGERGLAAGVQVFCGLALAVAVAAAPAQAHRPGCTIGETYPRGHPHRVYAMPHGCVWLYRPDGGYFSIGPQIHTRIHGSADGVALARDPIGQAAAVCGMTSFVVAWPTFVVTARRVAWGDGTGCHVVGAERAVTWSGRFLWRPREGRRPARWEAVLERTSTPLVRRR